MSALVNIAIRSMSAAKAGWADRVGRETHNVPKTLAASSASGQTCVVSDRNALHAARSAKRQN